MATYIWTGASSATWTTSANWKNEQGTAYAAGYPGSGNDLEDDVILDGVPTNQLEAKDASGLAKLRSIRVGTTYDDYVGSQAAAYLQVDAAEAVIQATAASAVYLQGNTSIDRITVLDGTVYLKGTFGDVALLKGTVVFDATTTISTSLTIGSVTSSSDVTVTIPAVTALPATINAYAGTVICGKGTTTLNANGATWTQSAGDITTINQTGGTFGWNGGNITTLYQYAGTFTAAGSATARRIGNAYIYPGAFCNLNNGQDTILVSGYVRSLGGSVQFGGGTDIAPAATTTYTGAGDLKLGVTPQVVNNTNVDGDEVYVGPFDRLDIYCTTGVVAAGSALTFKLQESTASGGSYSDISGKEVTFDDTEGGSTKLLSLWGYERAATKPWIKLNVANGAAADALLSANYVLSTF